MKQSFLAFSLLVWGCVCSAVEYDQGERRIIVEGPAEKVENVEIVVPEQTRLLKFTARELSTILRKATGREIPVTSKPTEGRFSIFLGDNSYSRKAGLAVERLPEGGFYILRSGNSLYLAGLDSGKDSPEDNRWGQRYPKRTLTAAYDFLERFAGVRFYFPGEIGTVIPKRSGLFLPRRIDILDRPDLIDTSYYSRDPQWYDGGVFDGLKGMTLDILRYRMSDFCIPFGHGLAFMNYTERFGRSHPEYFARKTDGTRSFKIRDGRKTVQWEHLCYSSGIREIIYQDVKAYFTGVPPEGRGIPGWNVNAAAGKYFSVMPDDGLIWCACPACSRLAPGGAGTGYVGKDAPSRRISNHLWKLTADIARRLGEEKIKGNVTQMAYGVMDRIPDCDIPSNVAVQLAVLGLGKGWSCSAERSMYDVDRERIESWSRKIRGRVSIWAYPGKYGQKDIPGLPAMMPHEIGRYFKAFGGKISGAFMEMETDRAIFTYLNLYMFGKMSWNPDYDPEALLREHHLLMFGKGAPMMTEFYDDLEMLWCEKVIGNVMNTPVGPIFSIPHKIELFTDVYSKERLRKFNALFDRAEKAAAGDADSLRRIRFIREHMLGPILQASELYWKQQASVLTWRFHPPEKIWLRPLNGEVCDVNTSVEVRRDNGALIVTFDCEEPEMARMKADYKGRDQLNLFRDSCVEIFLNPSGDRKTYYHFVVNSTGSLYDAACTGGGRRTSDPSWDCPGVSAKVSRSSRGWQCEVAIPERSLPGFSGSGFPVNFARNRALRDQTDVYFQWSPVPGRNFHDIRNYGMMDFRKPRKQNLVRNPVFEDYTPVKWFEMPQWSGFVSNSPKFPRSGIHVDGRVFLKGGRSVRLFSRDGGYVELTQKLPKLRKNTSYRVSYSLRTTAIASGKRQGFSALLYYGPGKYSFVPERPVAGSFPWHTVSAEVVTPKEFDAGRARICFRLRDATGDAWVDNVIVEEAK